MRDAAWNCDWVEAPVSVQRSLVFIIAMASKEFTLTAGKFVPVSRTTMLNVRSCINVMQEMKWVYLACLSGTIREGQ